MPYANNQGTQIYYEIEGTGPPLVLAHGIGASLQDWRDVGWAVRLRDRFKLVLVDARGHGRSDKPHDPEAYRQADQANDHLAVLDDAGIERAHFLGWSMGGIVCLGAGIVAPDRCLTLMMGAMQPYARNERPPADDLPTPIAMRGLPTGENPIQALLSDGGEAWANFYAANMPMPRAMRQRHTKNDFVAVAARFDGMHEPRSAPGYLDPVQMPCLVYVGEHDAVYGGAKQLADRLPNGTFMVFPGLNHFEMFSEVDVVLPEILRFLGLD